MKASVALALIGPLFMLLCGCSKLESRFSPAGARAVGQGGGSAENRRYIAVSHRLQIETEEDAVPKAWQAAADFCRLPRCEVLSSSINNKTEDSPPSASLSLRIVPEDLPKLLDLLGKSGSVAQHATESEDKTAVVIDVEAKLKNLTEFRNRLRSMLSRPGNLKDLIEVERELVRVQSELDSLASRRKVLANETEKVALRIEFFARRSIGGVGVSAPIAHAWQNAARVLSYSVATLLTVVVVALPWLLLIVPVFWLVVKLVRRLFRRRTASHERAASAQ